MAAQYLPRQAPANSDQRPEVREVAPDWFTELVRVSRHAHKLLRQRAGDGWECAFCEYVISDDDLRDGC
jgi:hypothetical protein